jgi:hypothetical protein
VHAYGGIGGARVGHFAELGEDGMNCRVLGETDDPMGIRWAFAPKMTTFLRGTVWFPGWSGYRTRAEEAMCNLNLTLKSARAATNNIAHPHQHSFCIEAGGVTMLLNATTGIFAPPYNFRVSF